MQNPRKLIKSALGPATTLGLLGGLVSGRGDDRLRTAARGAAKGFGTDLGVLAGGGLGLGLGMVTGAPILGAVGGGIGGGMLGHSLASEAVGPYETEEEKFERMLEAREAAQEKMKMKTAYEFGAKIAASSCVPCHTPNGPTNKKPYTSVSPAVTDAGQQSVEIGKPPVTETEHSEAKAKQPEEGVKSAYEFGKKVAAVNTASGIPRYNVPTAEELMDSDVPPVGLPSGVMHPSPSYAARMERLRHEPREGHPGLHASLPPLPASPNAPTTSTASGTWADKPAKPAVPLIGPGGSRTSFPVVPPNLPTGPRGPRGGRLTSNNIPAGYTTRLNDKGGTELVPSGRTGNPRGGRVTSNNIPDGYKAQSDGKGRTTLVPASAAPTPPANKSNQPTTKQDPTAVLNSVLGPVPAADIAAAEAAAKTKPEPTKTDPAAEGGWGNLPAYAAGGLGAAGLAALLYHMANQPKKKRRDEEDA